MDRASIPQGFTINEICLDQMILVTIEDHRAQPCFKGDRSADEWSGILQSLAGEGLDPAKAVMSLGCYDEPTENGSSSTYNVRVVRLGWMTSAAKTHGKVNGRLKPVIPPVVALPRVRPLVSQF